VKARRYAVLGIRHYCLVDPEASRLEWYRAEAGAYVPVAQGEGNASLSHPDWPGLTLTLGDLWR
jgi:Uma2 family endonuclease